MIAVIEVGGKQYCVAPGQKINVNRLPQQTGETIEFADLLANGKITAIIAEHTRGPKVMIRKFRNKTRYHRVKGHRQPMTVLHIAPQPQEKPAPRRKKAEAPVAASVSEEATV